MASGTAETVASSASLSGAAGSAELTAMVPVTDPLRGIHPVGLESLLQRATVSASRAASGASAVVFGRVMAFIPSPCLFPGGSRNIEAGIRMHDSRYRRFAALGILGVAVSTSCGESPTAATQFGPPASLNIVTGNRQTGAAGQALPEPLTVQVLDSAGHPLWGQTVNWTVLPGNGTLFACAVPTETDSAGLVLVLWQLGAGVGPQGVIAYAGHGLTVAFSAPAEIPPSQQVSLVSGGGQQDTVGATLAQPLVIRVLQPDGTPDTGAAVSWRAISRGSTYAPPNTRTDAQGQASTSWTLGTVAEFESTAVFIAGFTPR